MLEPASTGMMAPVAHRSRSRRPPPETQAIFQDAAATRDVDAVRRDGERRASSVPAPQIQIHCVYPEFVLPRPHRTQSPRCCETIPRFPLAAPAQTLNRASEKQFPPQTIRQLRNSAGSAELSQSTL